MIVTAPEFIDKYLQFCINGAGVQPVPNGTRNPKKKRKYIDLITAFDIETTRLEDIEQSIMYVWQWQFGQHWTVIGRTWDEFQDLTSAIAELVEADETLCVFVHNLSYEFQFLRGIYSFKPEEVFALKSRKVLKCSMYDERLEFRCSYLHSNMNLDTYTKKMGVKHQKLTGTFDYNKKRYPWTELLEDEIAYCVHDVQGLVEAIEIEMQHDKDDIRHFPLTSTGYVRRDAKQAMSQVRRGYAQGMFPNEQIYTMLREAFRGGNTHANRYYACATLHNVHSADRSSSYPDVQCNCEFPISEFTFIWPEAGVIYKMLHDRHKALLMRVAFTGARLRRIDWGCPYLSRDKCRNIRGALYDNGRILSAEYFETTLTDVDLRIILDEYVFDKIEFIQAACARYGKLPAPLVNCTISYYRAKTELKNVQGQELLYLKSKNKLNSIYGMSAQDPVKQSILFIDNEFQEQNERVSSLLEQSKKRAFMCYQWGVWVTAWARWRLEEGIRLAHGNINDPNAPQFIYCDTDSVKYLGNIDWTEFNEARKCDSLESGAYATDPHGETHYMGVFEPEHDMCEFRTMGAKKYVYRETPESPLVCTIAGVGKKKGGVELEAAGGIEAFKSGFTFRAAGGLESVYNDDPEIKEVTIDGHKLSITSNVVLRPSTYTLGLAADYERLLTTIQPKF